MDIKLTKREAEAVQHVLGRGIDEIVDGDIEGGAYSEDPAYLRKVKNEVGLARQVRRRIQEEL
jgi:hypothetical protein